MAQPRKLNNIQRNQAIALSELGESNTKIGKMLGVKEATIRRVKKEYEELSKGYENGELESKRRDIEAIKSKFANKCEFVLDNLFQGITQSKIDKANLKDTAISIGIISEKLALFSNMATQNVDVRHNLVNKIRTTQQAE